MIVSSSLNVPVETIGGHLLMHQLPPPPKLHGAIELLSDNQATVRMDYFQQTETGFVLYI